MNAALRLPSYTDKVVLERQIAPFNRLDCNGSIRPVTKRIIEDRLPPKTRRYYDEFFQCGVCQKIYWKGPHFRRMLNKLGQLTGTDG